MSISQKLSYRFFRTSDGIRIHYRATEGRRDDTWIIWVHGLGGDCNSFEPEQVAMAKEGYPSIAVDLRGHGLSDRPRKVDDYKLERSAKDIIELTLALGLQNVILVGHSMGGMVAMNAASMHKLPLKALVLIGSGTRSSFFGMPTLIPRALAKLLKVMIQVLPQSQGEKRRPYTEAMMKTEVNLRRLIEDVKTTSVRSYLSSCCQAFVFEGQELTGKINSPTLILCGSDDRVYPPALAQQLCQTIKQSELELIDKANHICVIKHPQEVSRMIVNYLDKFSEK